MARIRRDLAEDKAPLCVAAVVIMGSISTFFVIARMGSRRIVNKKWDWSDYTVLFGFVGAWFLNAATLEGVAKGFGHHIEDTKPENMVLLQTLTFSAQLIYILSITSIKISILSWYSTIFVAKRHRIAIYIVGFVALGWMIGFICAAIMLCKPVSNWWNDLSTCHDLTPFYVASAASNSAIDIIILGIPIWAISGLTLKKRQKSHVIGLFMFGGVVIGATIARLICALFFSINDISYTYVSSVISAIVEIHLAVVSACLPLLPPLIKRAMNAMNQIVATDALPTDYSFQRSRIKIWAGITSLRGRKAGNRVKIEANAELPGHRRRLGSGCSLEMLHAPNAGIQVDKEVLMTYEHEIYELPPPTPSTVPSLPELTGRYSVTGPPSRAGPASPAGPASTVSR